MKYEKEASEVPQLRTQVDDLSAELKLAQGKIAELRPWLESDTGKAAEAMKGDLRFYRTMSYVGFACSVLLGLAFAASYFLLKPLPTAPARGRSRARSRPSTHRIE